LKRRVLDGTERRGDSGCGQLPVPSSPLRTSCVTTDGCGAAPVRTGARRPARVVAGATGASASGSPFMFSPSSVAPRASSASSTPCAGRPPRRRHHDRPLRNRNVHHRQRDRCVCRPAKRYRNRSRQPIWPFVAPGSDHPATNRGGTCLGIRSRSP